MENLSKNKDILYLEKIISLMPGNIYWKDRAGKYLGCNQNIALLAKCNSPKDVIGKTLHELIEKKYADSITRIDEDIMTSGKETLIEEKGFTPDGKPAIYLTRKTPLFDEEGNVIGLSGISLDITEQKKLERSLQQAKEKAETANQAKSRFLAVASHELRIPLTGILGLIDFLKEEDLSPKEKAKQFDMLENCAKHLYSLVNDILDFAKLESDKIEITPVPIDLKELIENVASTLKTTAKAKGLDLQVQYPPAVPHQIIADPRALRRIIMNLLSNAVKFTEQGFIAISVNCLAQNTQHAQLEIAIKDTGKGIPADKQEIIFERFQQLDDPYVRPDSRAGTGLGLTITKELVELMSGEIHVESTPDKGSVFKITLEFPLQDEKTKTSPWADYAAKVKILIIDDSPRGKVLCTHTGSSQTETISSKKALSELLSAQQLGQPYQIIIVDDNLRHEDAYQLMEEISQQKNLQPPMPILLVAKATLNQKKQAEKAGFFSCIAKPAQPTLFQTHLTALWENWHDLQEQHTLNTQKNTHSLKVLLIDDDKIVRFVNHRMLSDFTSYIDQAENGKQALAMLNTHADNYDIVFVDLGLPDINGLEVIKEIRQREIKSNAVNIIALTGYTGDEELQACLTAGANEVTTKPVERHILLDILARYSK